MAWAGRLWLAVATWLASCTSDPSPASSLLKSPDAKGSAGDVTAFEVGVGWTGPTQDDLFDASTVQRVELTIDEADLAKMHAALPERVWVPATFRWRGLVRTNVGVRYKGDSSSSPNQTHKRGLLIRFNRFVKGQRLLGLRRLALDNGVQFGSLFSERLLSEILTAEGVVTARTSWATLTLNGANRGVYVLVERVDESFIAHRFGDTLGLLYKVHTGGPGADLQPLTSAESYAAAFSPETDLTETTGHAPLHTLCQKLGEISDDELPTWLEQHLDLQGFLRFTAVALLAGAFDQYTGWNPHNYYLHRAPGGRWTYVPWDLDVGFADNAFGCIPVIDAWNVAWPLPRTPRPLLQRIVTHPKLLARYRAEANRLLEAWFRPTALATWFDQAHALLKDDLAADPFPAVRVTNPGVVGWPAIVADLKAFTVTRYSRARSELDAPKQTAPHTPKCGGSGPGKAPSPGTLTAPQPTQLQGTYVPGKGVALTWVDNATGEAGTIVQRCAGAMCADFQNHIGLPGDAHTSATDTKVQGPQTLRYRVFAWLPTPQGGAGSLPSTAVSVQVP